MTSKENLEENRQMILAQDLEGLLRKNHFMMLKLINSFYPPNSERNDYWSEARIGLMEAMRTHDINNNGWAGWLQYKIKNRLYKFQEVQAAVKVSKHYRHIGSSKYAVTNQYITDSLDEVNELTNEPRWSEYAYEESEEPFDYDAAAKDIYTFVEGRYDILTQMVLVGRMWGMNLQEIADDLGYCKTTCETRWAKLKYGLGKRYGCNLSGHIFKKTKTELIEASRVQASKKPQLSGEQKKIYLDRQKELRKIRMQNRADEEKLY